MKCYEIIDQLEALSPTEFAEEWDNIGLLAAGGTKRSERFTSRWMRRMP